VGNPTFLAKLEERLWSVNRDRWFRMMVSGKGYAPSAGFFDSYPRFFSTSSTASVPDRLNQRHRALIQSNADIISGRSVLDIASHDGRWSLAAHKAGAQYVLGIEARQHLTEAARANMREYGVPAGQAEFLQGDVMVELDRLESGRFDTVFCFGFLYHTLGHLSLFRKFERLKPRSLVIDTAISARTGSIIEVRDEPELESAAAVGDPGNPARAIKGIPAERPWN